MLSELERAVLRLAEALTETPSEVDDELYGYLAESLGRPALVELASAIAWKNYLARFNRVYQISEDDFPG